MRTPKGSPYSKSKQPIIVRRRGDAVWAERGRSRVSKDLRGGAIPYYPSAPSSPILDYSTTSTYNIDSAHRV